MIPEFKSHESYRHFACSAKAWRYNRSPDDEVFLDALIQTAERKMEGIPVGSPVWRAQVGFKHLEGPHGCVEIPLDADRMKPPREWKIYGRAAEGRINPKGIPILYTSTTEAIAMHEVRPSPGQLVIVAELRTCRDFRVLNVTVHESAIPNIVYFAEPSVPEREEAVWRDIDRAFSEPVERSDDHADYVGTQSISEVFRKRGLDGIAYRSAFGKGHNIAFFDLDAAQILSCQLYEVTDIHLSFSTRGNPK